MRGRSLHRTRGLSLDLSKRYLDWAADRDLHALIERAARLCAAGGTLFVSSSTPQCDRWLG